MHPSSTPQPAAPGRDHARARPEDEAEPAPLAGPSPPRPQLPRTPSLRRPHLLCAVLCATHHGARQFTPRLRGRARALRGSDVRAGRASGTIAFAHALPPPGRTPSVHACGVPHSKRLFTMPPSMLAACCLLADAHRTVLRAFTEHGPTNGRHDGARYDL